MEEVRSPFCNEYCDQVENEVIKPFLGTVVKDIVHLKCEDIEDMFLNSLFEESNVSSNHCMKEYYVDEQIPSSWFLRVLILMMVKIISLKIL